MLCFAVCNTLPVAMYTHSVEDLTARSLPLTLQVVQGFNADPAVHGILVQLPLPKHINEQRILDAVSFEKDVDGFHPQNIGCLAMRTRDPLFICCTPKVSSQACARLIACFSWHAAIISIVPLPS